MTVIALSQVEALRRVLEAQAAELHVAMPGIVQSYDAASQTAEIRPAIRSVLPAFDEDDEEDELIELPILPSVPVAWPRGGGFYVHLPLVEGDSVLVVFCETDINPWRNSGDVSDPGVALRHILSGAVAIPGLFPRGDVLSDADNTNMRMGLDGGNHVEVRTDGEVRCGGAKQLAEFQNLQTHLDKVAAGLDALAARIAVLDMGAVIEANYGVAAKAILDVSNGIATEITKGD